MRAIGVTISELCREDRDPQDLRVLQASLEQANGTRDGTFGDIEKRIAAGIAKQKSFQAQKDAKSVAEATIQKAMNTTTHTPGIAAKG